MKKKKGKVPNCKECKPDVMDENLPIMFLIERYMPTMVTEYGVSAEGVTLALNEFWVDENDKSSYSNRIIRYLNALKSEINKDK